LQQARTVNVGLTGLAVAAPSETLRQRIFTDIEFLASKVTEEEIVWRERAMRRRRSRRYAFVGTLAAASATGFIGVPVAQMLLASGPPAPFTTFTDTAGQTWRLSGNFNGFIRISDAHGNSIAPGAAYVGLGGDTNGVLDIDVAGRHFAVQSYGDHLLRDAQGEYIGTIFLNPVGISRGRQVAQKLDPMADQIKRLAPELQNTTQTIEALPWGTVGIDRPAGVIWRMRGRARVQMLKPGAGKPFAAAENAYLPPEKLAKLSPAQRGAAERTTPEFIWTVHGRAGHATGFGIHPIRDEQGRNVLLLRADPLPK
jgi:hypothetical protein